jgi:hypothetical protein
MITNKRIIIFFIFVGLFSLSFWIGSQSQVSNDDAQEFLKEFEALIEGIDAVGIFTHNLTIAMPMFIPGFGIAWGFFASWQTGFAFAALATTTPILNEIHPLYLLYLSPFGIMELVAYSLAMSRSFLLIHKIIKKISIAVDYKIIGIEIGIVVGLLLVGGFLESHMITLVEESGMEMPFLD